MDSKIFIPGKIRVGYQERSDCYTKMLAYVIYYDEKNKIRKEASWQSWRNKTIEPNDFDNLPTSGFVINKKVGDYHYSSWEQRKAHIRIYDPRGFEFEISPENLLYILENANSIKGKGLDGLFVYGWYGSDLVLIPEESPDYQKMKDFSNLRTNPEKIVGKDLVLGGTYKTNMNNDWIYMGRYDLYEIYSGEKYNKGKTKGLFYYFWNGSGFEKIKSLSGRISKVVSLECVDNYAELMGELEKEEFYSPWDESKDIFIDFSNKDKHEFENLKYAWQAPKIFLNTPFGQIKTRLSNRNNHGNTLVDKWFLESSLEPNKPWSYGYRFNYQSHDDEQKLYQKSLDIYNWQKELFPQVYGTIDEINNVFHLQIRKQYLENGKERKNDR